MSIKKLLENVQKPWANIRINNLDIDGTLSVNGDGYATNSHGTIYGAYTGQIIVSAMNTFYAPNAGSFALASGSNNFIAQNLSGNVKLEYTGSSDIIVDIYFTTRLSMASSDSVCAVGIAINDSPVARADNFIVFVPTANSVTVSGHLVNYPMTLGDTISLLFKNISSTDDIFAMDTNFAVGNK